LAGGCVDTQTDTSNCGSCVLACTGGTCVNGECQCPTGLQWCPLTGGCVDTRTDTNNCGGCDLVCRGGTCVKGQCQCPRGETFCADFRECCPSDLGCCVDHCCCPPGTSFCPVFGVCCPDGQECCYNGCCSPDEFCCGLECLPSNFSCCPSPHPGDTPYSCPPETPTCCGFFECCPAA
jgi:hypothetical protein